MDGNGCFASFLSFSLGPCLVVLRKFFKKNIFLPFRDRGGGDAVVAWPSPRLGPVRSVELRLTVPGEADRPAGTWIRAHLPIRPAGMVDQIAVRSHARTNPSSTATARHGRVQLGGARWAMATGTGRAGLRFGHACAAPIVSDQAHMAGHRK